MDKLHIKFFKKSPTKIENVIALLDMTTPTKRNYGKAIAEYCERHGLTWDQFGAMNRRSGRTVHNWSKNQHLPTGKDLAFLDHVLDNPPAPATPGRSDAMRKLDEACEKLDEWEIYALVSDALRKASERERRSKLEALESKVGQEVQEPRDTPVRAKP